MEQFGHYFEFFAGLNAVYIVSNHFLIFISTHISSRLQHLNEALISVQQIHNANESGIKDNTATYGDKVAPDAVKGLMSKSDDLKNNLVLIDEQITTAKELGTISPGFNRICLYASLYCILMLVLIGFNFNFSSIPQRESFLVFNFISIIFLYRSFKKHVIPPFTEILLNFLYAALLSAVWFVIAMFWNLVFCNYDFSYFNRIIAVVAPAVHFLWYYIKTNRTAKNDANDIGKNITEAQKDNENFASEILGYFNAVKAMQKQV